MIIKDQKFFNWLEKNTNEILKKDKVLTYAIKKVVKQKMHFVNQMLMKNLRMILNFGHTFAHAIEAATT